MKRFIAAGATTLAVLSLAACSSGAGGSGGSAGGAQTTEEACDIIEASMVKLESELNEVGGDSEEQMNEMVIAAKNHLEKLNKEITNEEVAEVWAPISELQIQGLEAAAAGNTDELMAAYTELSEHYEAFDKVCPQGAAPQS